MNRANLGSGVLALLIEALKWVTFAVRMQAINDYLDERSALLKKIQTEMVRIVPDKQQIIEKVISQIRKESRTATDAEKKQARILNDRLGLILEQSYAFYGKE